MRTWATAAWPARGPALILSGRCPTPHPRPEALMAHASAPTEARDTPRTAVWPTLARAGIAYFALAIVALHFLRPETDPIARTTSEYAVGPYGYVMGTAFLAMALAMLGLVMALRHRAPAEVRSRWGLALLTWWGVAVIVAMVFPIDVQGTAPTTAGTIHRINGPIGFLAATAGVFLLSRRFGRHDRWRRIHRPALALSVVMMAAFVALALSLATQVGFAGLAQRMALTALVAWVLLVITVLSVPETVRRLP